MRCRSLLSCSCSLNKQSRISPGHKQKRTQRRSAICSTNRSPCGAAGLHRHRAGRRGMSRTKSGWCASASSRRGCASRRWGSEWLTGGQPRAHDVDVQACADRSVIRQAGPSWCPTARFALIPTSVETRTAGHPGYGCTAIPSRKRAPSAAHPSRSIPCAPRRRGAGRIVPVHKRRRIGAEPFEVAAPRGYVEPDDPAYLARLRRWNGGFSRGNPDGP